ncbi:hypothetical protein AB8Z38_11565 [Bradyrhizobium sp. LLZ17]|uniref:Uncharacterized protein n=1 Tax=Bradyrhizobium sp. LLZ17 TaxID=3239388 RepID=A0AB39XPU8_9BRAD
MDKPTPPTNRQRRREQQRRHRLRQREGRRVYPVELDGSILSMLVDLRWLDDDKAGDHREVGAAVRRLLIEAASGLPPKKP